MTEPIEHGPRRSAGIASWLPELVQLHDEGAAS
jgi:hypothetical protein